MSKKMIWLTGGLFVALLVVAGGVAGLLLMNQSQDTRQQAATPSGTVNFSFSKPTMTLQPNGTDSFQVMINTGGADLTGFTYRLIYPVSSGISLVSQEKNPSLVGVGCEFFANESGGQQKISANCTLDGLTAYSNSVATPVATIVLKAGAQAPTTPTVVSFDMSEDGLAIIAADENETDIAAIPQGSLAVTVSAPAASTNASLNSLVVSQATLSPAFSGTTTNYSSTVANAVSSVTVTPTVADSTATVKVNGTTVASGTSSGAQSLNVGSNNIITEVTAGDGTTKKTYTVAITRSAAEQSSTSSTINLSSTQSCNPNEFKAKIEVKENNQAKANVITEFEFNTEKKNATTNASGVAETTFALPSAGSYTLTAKPQGFADKSATVTITACTAATTTTTSTSTVQCNQTCNSTRVCGAGLSCVGGVCRNSSCQTDSTCTCKGGTNVASQSGTSALPSSGSVDRTLALFLIGSLLMLGGGQILVARYGQDENVD